MLHTFCPACYIIGMPEHLRRFAPWGCVAAIILVVAFLRLPSFGDIFCDPDVAGAAYSAQELLTGGSLYGDTVETKPPGTYLLFALLFSVLPRSMTWIYVLAALIHIGVAFILYLMGRDILGRTAGFAAAFLYAVYSASPACSGLCPNFETWALFPAALGVHFLWRRDAGWRLLRSALAGACLGCAVLFKQTFLFLAPAAVAFLAVDQPPDPSRAGRLNRFLKETLASAIGAVLPIVATLAFFAARRDLGPLVAALRPSAVMSYVSTGEYGYEAVNLTRNAAAFLWGQKFFTLLLILFAIFMFVESWKREAEPATLRGSRIAGIWLLGALACAAAGTKFFAHYFILLVPPLCLVGAISFALIVRRARAFAPILAILFIAGPLLDMRQELRVSAVSLLELVKLGRIDMRWKGDNFWRDVEFHRMTAWNMALKDAGTCIRQNTAGDDSIYVWDYEPGLYWYADRRSPTRHFMYFNVATDMPPGDGRWHAVENDAVRAARLELLRDLRQRPPSYVAVRAAAPPMPPPGDYFHIPAPMFPRLAEFLSEGYERDAECSNRYLVVYSRTKQTPVTQDDAPLLIPARLPAGTTQADLETLKDRLRRIVATTYELSRFIDSPVFRDAIRRDWPFEEDTVIADVGAGTGALTLAVLLSGRPFARIYTTDAPGPSTDFKRFILGAFFSSTPGPVEYVIGDGDVMLPYRTIDAAATSDNPILEDAAKGGGARDRAVLYMRSLALAMKRDGVVRVFQSWIDKPDEKHLSFQKALFREAGFRVLSAAPEESCRCDAFLLGL